MFYLFYNAPRKRFASVVRSVLFSPETISLGPWFSSSRQEPRSFLTFVTTLSHLSQHR